MIAVISGSSREANNSIRLARHVAGLYRELGEAVEVLDLGRLPAAALAPEGYASKPEALQRDFIDPVLAADGLVVVVPEYNGSYPGILKHFIDLLPFPESFECRPVAFVGHSGGYYGALRAVEQLQMIFAYRNAYLFNRRVFIPAVGTVLGPDGEISDADLKQRLAQQAARFVAFCRALQSIA